LVVIGLQQREQAAAAGRRLPTESYRQYRI